MCFVLHFVCCIFSCYTFLLYFCGFIFGVVCFRVVFVCVTLSRFVSACCINVLYFSNLLFCVVFIGRVFACVV